MNSLKAVAQQSIGLIDLTTLNNDDTDEVIVTLCQQAITNFGNTAAICIYPKFIPIAKKQLLMQGTPSIKIATVVNFPHGNDDINAAVTEAKIAVASGADEIDIVFPYRAFMKGDEQVGFDLVQHAKEVCGKALLKVIIESGELHDEVMIRQATKIAIEAGADFIKTSTGKVPVNATLEASRIILTEIRDLGVQDRVGFKAAGGVRSAIEAQQYLDNARQIMGDEWLTKRFYRFGASSLLKNLLAVLNENDVVNVGGY